VQPPWRPNFRQTETLPDVKVIRTDFILNGVALVLFLVVLGIGAVQELNLMNLRASAEVFQSQIDENQAANRALIRQNGQFRRVAGRLKEVTAFEQLPVSPTTLLRGITESIPEGVVLDNINFRRQEERVNNRPQPRFLFTISGVVANAGETSESQLATLFRDQLTENPAWRDYTLSGEFVSVGRTNAGGVWSFQIEVKMQPQPLEN